MPTKSPLRKIDGVGLEVTNHDGEKIIIPIRFKFRELRRALKGLSAAGDDIDAIFDALPKAVAEAVDEVDADLGMPAVQEWATMLNGAVGETPAS